MIAWTPSRQPDGASRTRRLAPLPAGQAQPGTARPVLAATAACAILAAVTGCMAQAAARSAPAVMVIAVTATANEPRPALSAASLAMLRSAGDSHTNAVAYVMGPASGQPARLPLTPRRADGQVEYGPQRQQILDRNVARVRRAVGNEEATGPFNLLNVILAASRVTAPTTMLILSSGLTTSGGLDMRKAGWDASPRSIAAQLKRLGDLPDLSGWTLIFSGLAGTAGRQPALPLPQQTTLGSYWLAICREAGATACRLDESPRLERPSLSTVPVPVVRVPKVRSATGPHHKQSTILPTALLFRYGKAVLVTGADHYLEPIVAEEQRAGSWVSITGHASPDGGTAAYNRKLSLARARAVRARLIALGLPPQKITHIAGVGTAHASCTVAGALDEARCATLRRVVIVLSLSPTVP
jgi:outer membrane protein OmpA-like peptidoglycan-associated protein